MIFLNMFTPVPQLGVDKVSSIGRAALLHLLGGVLSEALGCLLDVGPHTGRENAKHHTACFPECLELR